jgi:pimeloyl-ACP methyl ester carboxylesterase
MDLRTTRVGVGGTGIHVTHAGDPANPTVLLLHGFPDSHRLWRHVVGPLVEAGHHVIAPDLRGFGGSDVTTEVADQNLFVHAGDVAAVLDHLGVEAAHVVGHDFGAALSWLVATVSPERVRTLTALSVGHPSAFQAAGFAQRERSWYMLFFQFEGLAERWILEDDGANFRAWGHHPDHEAVAAAWRDDPARLTAQLGMYRANVPAESFLAPPLELPPVTVPTMGVWSSGEHALTEVQMTGSAEHVAGPWRYERLEGPGHWIPLEAPDALVALLVDHLASG